MIIRESVRKMEDIKYFTKQILIEYNNAAIREKRNRAIEEQFLESLQEGVLYPIVFKMYHTKDEIRVQIDFFENNTIITKAITALNANIHIPSPIRTKALHGSFTGLSFCVVM